MASFLYNEKIGLSIIDSIPHCNNENASKKGKNQDMWLHVYIEDKIGVSIIDSIPHCHTEMLSKGAKIKKCGFVSTFLDRMHNWSIYHR